jgi:hypothetical protein
LKINKVTIAAITVAMAACMEEEEKAVRLAILQRRPVMLSSSWIISGYEEIMPVM